MTDRGRAEVPNEPLREAFLSSGLSQYEVARRVGWLRRRSPRNRARYTPKVADVPVPDGTRVARALGLRSESGKGRHRRTISYEAAVALADAIGADYTEVGV